ncbi:alternative ribosome rescue aminoacyl-tRNA hydrolase ArfB [Salinisphaera sp. Q1T1-3]|uniref:alternative ribosome rescue aminoacyl-tRNA hydrolase ArfB n=1 Tax=Salinisphaera sp. Q1T1-3 TaxID=2321229 RepID=UPI000E744AA3|nr:alternative ribosome rescue aminoacyl-tRNA hydrolase ArfB [Salinisphaera sp. Q1T1-3]RJS94122.1 aminoacyl-tRNA hydrolase [Salinisphaera sp. Q1T1-3]
MSDTGELRISSRVVIPDREISWQAIRSPGPGGQKVNKTASAIHLRFDIATSSLPDSYKKRLLSCADGRITDQGVIVIKATDGRHQSANLAAARERLARLIAAAGRPAKKRRATRPSRAARARRADRKTQRGRLKALRRRPPE